MLPITETLIDLPNKLKRYGKVKNFENKYSDNCNIILKQYDFINKNYFDKQTIIPN